MQKVMLTTVGLVTTSEDGYLRLVDRTVCHGYANGCVCEACLERAELALLPSRRVAAQPWEPQAA